MVEVFCDRRLMMYAILQIISTQGTQRVRRAENQYCENGIQTKAVKNWYQCCTITLGHRSYCS